MHNKENNNQHEYDPQPLRISVLVLQKLEKRKYIPTPKAYFVLRNTLMWVLALFSILFGAFSVSGILFRMVNVFQVFPSSPRFGHVFDLFPLFWMLLFGLFMYVTYLEVRRTNQGYKYHLSWIAGLMLAVSGILGIVFYCVGVGFLLDKAAARYVPFNRDIEVMQKERWYNPEQGFLVGEVLRAEEKKEMFVLRDPEGGLWDVLFTAGLTDDERDIVSEGHMIGIKGMIHEKDRKLFIACRIVDAEIQGKGYFLSPRIRVLLDIGSSTNERNSEDIRMTICEGVRPL